MMSVRLDVYKRQPEDLGKAAEVFVLCVKLTSVEKLLATVR